MEKYQNGELQTSEARTYPAISGVLASDISGVEASIRTTTYTGSLLAYQESNQWQAFPSSRVCTAFYANQDITLRYLVSGYHRDFKSATGNATTDSGVVRGDVINPTNRKNRFLEADLNSLLQLDAEVLLADFIEDNCIRSVVRIDLFVLALGKRS